MLNNKDLEKIKNYFMNDPNLAEFSPLFQNFFNANMSKVDHLDYIKILQFLVIIAGSPQPKTHLLFTELEKLSEERVSLTLSEKNIHFIWLGPLTAEQTSYIKIWTYINPDYNIILWTAPNSCLLNVFKKHLIEFANNNPIKIILLQNEFYNNYYLRNLEKSFNQLAIQFLLDKKIIDNPTALNEIIANNEKELSLLVSELNLIHSQKEEYIRDISTSGLIFMDVETLQGFFKDMYLRQLPSVLSDRLRYNILKEFGGFYVDIDTMPKINWSLIIEKLEQQTFDEEFEKYKEAIIIQIKFYIGSKMSRSMLEKKKIKAAEIASAQDTVLKRFDIKNVPYLITHIILNEFLNFLYHQKKFNFTLGENIIRIECQKIINEIQASGWENLLLPLNNYSFNSPFGFQLSNIQGQQDGFLVAKQNNPVSLEMINSVLLIDRKIEDLGADFIDIDEKNLVKKYQKIWEEDELLANWRFDTLFYEISTLTRIYVGQGVNNAIHNSIHRLLFALNEEEITDKQEGSLIKVIWDNFWICYGSQMMMLRKKIFQTNLATTCTIPQLSLAWHTDKIANDSRKNLTTKLKKLQQKNLTTTKVLKILTETSEIEELTMEELQASLYETNLKSEHHQILNSRPYDISNFHKIIRVWNYEQRKEYFAKRKMAYEQQKQHPSANREDDFDR
ncbi:TcdA/TcdB catalytic glycosyltransferase domain-containing protein [Spiroplasma eriocheiris]|uniref:Toxin A n=1 Tax=Spiroplasma eriocheiris TaxID=315358 RepID=A0A0H3XJ07_9MOLU|nr:TcdA/TcdB catalytic glycosyltransferase domain-containing protein [Spiroplasma eriocheiris]AHF58091.1 truncated toxin A [Spiroplasma eriocheiris CCTCC M 207170]AKM54530.1 toxin A [Spiroplasma eriocheiris]